MLLGTCGTSKGVLPAWCPIGRKEISQCKRVQPCIEHTVMVSHAKRRGKKACQMHRSVEINACTAMECASPPSVGQTGKQECSKQGKEGTAPLPTAPGFYQVSALSLLPTGRLSGHRRQPCSLCCQQCKHSSGH